MPVGKRKKTQNLDFQMEFYEKIVAEKPDFIQALIALGEIYTKKGLYQKGLELDLRLSSLRPDNPIIHYNLACSLSLTGDVDGALRVMEQAVHLGYKDVFFMERDPDLENLRKDERYQKLVRKIKRRAVTAESAKTR